MTIAMVTQITVLLHVWKILLLEKLDVLFNGSTMKTFLDVEIYNNCSKQRQHDDNTILH